MADNEPTQNLDASAQKDEEEMSNICAVFYSGMRVMAGAYLLDRLRLALSIYLVNSWKAVDEEFHTMLSSRLDEVKQLKGRIENRAVARDIESYLWEILKSLESLEREPRLEEDDRYKKINGIYLNCLDISKKLEGLRTTKRVAEDELLQNKKKTEGIDKTWCIQESPLLKEAMVHIDRSYKIEKLKLDLEGDMFKDFSQRMKVAAVHGILILMDYGLPLFKDIEKTGFLLFEDFNGFEGKTVVELLDYIHNDRNKFGHTAQLNAEKGIDKFVGQFNEIDEFLNRYFGDDEPEMPAEEKRKHLKYLFSDIPDYMTTNKLTNACANFKVKLLDRVPKLVSENERLELTVSLWEKEKKLLADDVWSTVEEYYKKHKPTLISTDEVYQKLLGLVRNPNEIESGDDQLVRDLRQAHRLPPRAMQLSSPANDVTPQMREGPVNTTTADESSQAVDVVGGDFGGQKQDEDEVDCLE